MQCDKYTYSTTRDYSHLPLLQLTHRLQVGSISVMIITTTSIKYLIPVELAVILLSPHLFLFYICVYM